MVIRYLYCLKGVNKVLCSPDSSARGFRTLVKYLDSWQIGDPQKETMGRIGMLLLSSFDSRFSAFYSSGVKVLFGSEADCKEEVALILILSLVDSDSSCSRNRSASTLDTIGSVGICLGVTECLSPKKSTSVSISSTGCEEILLTQLASGLRSLAFFVSCSRVSFSFVFVRCCPVVLSARLSAIVYIVVSKSLLYFVVVVIETSVTVVPRSDNRLLVALTI